MMMKMILIILTVWTVNSFAYKCATVSRKIHQKSLNPCATALYMTPTPIYHPLSAIIANTMQLSDTSISEEDVLSVTGELADLPNPLYAVGLAAFILIGVGLLQFTLGDLTKEVCSSRCNTLNSSVCKVTYIVT